MPLLQLWRDYTRQEAHDILDPTSNFTPQSGTWGLQGIVKISDRPGDYAFFVTFGQQQAGHDFEESISDDGVLVWQSQPRQGLSDRQIQEFIEHDDLTSTIHLFLRTAKRLPYTYLGTLGYLEHDPRKERPVHFAWQLLDGAPPEVVCERMNLGLLLATPRELVEPRSELSRKPLPAVARPREQRSLRSVRPVLSGQDARNAALGLAGEQLVLRHEIDNLTAAGRADLARNVIHTSVIEGDGAGFDIRSFNPDGTDRFIEVKTTAGPATTAFFITPNEVAFANLHPDTYVLVRVYGYDAKSDSADFYEVAGAIDDHFSLTASEYRARLLPTSL